MISVVIPVKNAKESIKDTIKSILNQDYKNYDIIVVDDHSTDDTREALNEFSQSLSVVKNNGTGVASARNTGVSHAKGRIIYFIDADVIIPSDALRKIKEAFDDNRISGLVGLESTDTDHKGFFSNFKNLWMNYTFSNLPKYIHSFYTSSAAIKKADFLTLGGFDTNYIKPNVEDTAFGRKMANKGYLTIVLKDLLVLHKKKYDFLSLVKTDFLRTSGLLKIVLREKWQNFQRRNQSSVPLSFILSVPFPAFSLVFLLLCTVNIKLPVLSLLFVVLYLFFNRKFLIFVCKKKGGLFFLKSVLFMLLDSFIVLTGLLYGFFSFFILRKRY